MNGLRQTELVTVLCLHRPIPMLRPLIRSILLILILPTGVLSQSASRTIAIVNVNVLSMDAERVLERQTVLIRNGKILAIRPSLVVPTGARKIDGEGKYLTPGLIDAHVHLMSPDDLISYLAYGVTTVVNMSGTPDDLKLRREVRKGLRLGPNIYTAGPTIDGYPPLNEVFVTAETPEQGAAIVRENKRAGYDFIKVYGTLRPEVFRAIAGTCTRERIALTGHINRQIATREVFEARQLLAAHAEDLINARFDHPPSDAELATLADEVKSAGITITANVALNPATAAQIENLDAVLADGEAQHLSAATYSRWIRSNNRNLDDDPKKHLEQLRDAQAIDLKFLALLQERRVTLILGTDASAYGFPGQSAWEELKQTRAAGLTAYEAFATATRNAGAYLAEHIDHGSRIGTITPGSTADLLLWKSNPVKGELTQNNLVAVILRGQWLPLKEIQRRRNLAKKRLAKEHHAVEAIDSALEKGDVAAAQNRMKATGARSPLLDEWVYLTKARKAEQRLPVAIAIARLNVEQFPDRFSTHLLLADLLEKEGNAAGAKAEAKVVLTLQPHVSTAMNIVSKSEFTTIPARYLPGDYRLEFLHRSQSATGRLRIHREQNRWVGDVVFGDDVQPVREVFAGADQLWFKAGQDFQEKEVRLTILPSGKVNGTWWSSFGRNGVVQGGKAP